MKKDRFYNRLNFRFFPPLKDDEECEFYKKMKAKYPQYDRNIQPPEAPQDTNGMIKKGI
jgi:hypothetical protein